MKQKIIKRDVLFIWNVREKMDADIADKQRVKYVCVGKEKFRNKGNDIAIDMAFVMLRNSFTENVDDGIIRDYDPNTKTVSYSLPNDFEYKEALKK